MLLCITLLSFNALISNVFCVPQQSEHESERIVVKTSRGAIRGFHVNNNLLNNLYKGEGDVFLGIPFAKPPTGSRRFKKSEIIDKYEETVEANKYGNLCPQLEEKALPKPNDVETSEDCLSLNIFTPNVTDAVNKYPVMVYIYGGALMSGTAEMWMYHGIISNLVNKGVIWVSVNYRVGFYGFFTTYTEEFPPNRGIWDQITALQWIHEEISYFGGDPKRVTVIGHSAGACSASYLAMTPKINPDFVSKIIMMSASAEICFENVYGKFTQSFDRAEQMCNINARDGWTKDKVKKMVTCVSKLNHTQISTYDTNTFRWNAVVDGELFSGYPEEMHWRNIPMLSGTTSEECALYELWKLHSGEAKIDDYKTSKNSWEKPIKWWIEQIYGKDNVNIIMNQVKKEYPIPGKDDDGLAYIQYVTRVLSDMIYIQAVGSEAEMKFLQGLRNIWLWQVDFHTDYFSFYRLQDYKPVFHGIELFLLMQPDYAWSIENEPQRWTNSDLEVSNEIAVQFTEFAKHGRPSQDWEPFEPNRMNYWRIDYFKGAQKNKYPNGYGNKHFQFWKLMNNNYRMNYTKRNGELEPDPSKAYMKTNPTNTNSAKQSELSPAISYRARNSEK
uniref:Carboxylic ester hydrolase n=1 Tax=Syphacia muris TaxID=451379 RepID=A0A0N5A7Y0_9BILA